VPNRPRAAPGGVAAVVAVCDNQALTVAAARSARMNAADFDRFAVVVFAPADDRAEVETLRRRLPPSGRPILPAHVTVKGTFIQPVDLHRIAERIQRCCEEARPCTLVAEELQSRQDDEHATIWLEVREAAPLTALHWALVAALDGLCTTIYSHEIEGYFTPHLTLAQEFPVSALDDALAVLREVQPRYAFEAREVALVGRRGGTTWEEVQVFALGSPRLSSSEGAPGSR
jgi:2'-5' RNA ligase